MKFRQFSELLIIVALVAAIYAPPIQLAAQDQFSSESAVSPLNTGWGGTSFFVSEAKKMGYPVIYANSTVNDLKEVEGKALYVLMGSDTALTDQEQTLIELKMQSDDLSLLIAEGNQTNNNFLSKMFGITINGNPVFDHDSPFQDKRVLFATVQLNGTKQIRINVASPILQSGNAADGFSAKPIGYTGRQSYDAGNSSVGARVVAATIDRNGVTKGIIFSDSGVFINAILNSTENRDEQRVAASAIESLTQGDRKTTILIDNSHYERTSAALPFSIPPIGMLVAVFLIPYLETFNQTYDSFLASASAPLLLLIGVSTLVGTYFGLKRWMGRQPIGNDTPKVPVIESTRLIENSSKTAIAGMKMNGRFYLDTLAKLYYVLDDLVKREFGAQLEQIGFDDTDWHIGDRIGWDNQQRLVKIAKDLSMIRDKAEGRRRFLFPPVLSWKRKFSQITAETDKVLKAMGTYLVESEGKEVRGIEYRLRKR